MPNDKVDQPLYGQDSEIEDPPYGEADQLRFQSLHGSMSVHRSGEQEDAEAKEHRELNDLKRCPTFALHVVAPEC